MKKHFSKFKLLSIFLCLTIVVLAGVLLMGYMNTRTRRAAVRARIKAEIQRGITENSFNRKVEEFMDESYSEAELEAKKLNYWLLRLGSAEYDGVQLGMWDADERCEEWYYRYFLKNFTVVPCNFKTPEQISFFLNAVFSSGNSVERVVLYLDPVALYENYRKSFLNDSEDILTFPQEYRESVLSYVAGHPEVDFSLNLPIYSAAEWARKSEVEEEDILSFWNDFVYYGSWYTNVKIHAMGTEDWLIVNRDSFDNGRMVPDVSEKVFALENTESYLVDGESIGSNISVLQETIRKERNHEYSYGGLYGYDVLFVGDSIFDQYAIDELSVSGYVKAFTNSDCYNLSLCGTSAYRGESEYSFVEVTEWLRDGTNGFPEDSRCRRELNRLKENEKTDKKTMIVVEYGFNDYCAGISVEDYTSAIKEGIENLLQVYPGAKILLISPLFTEYGNYGTESFGNNTGLLKEYVIAEGMLAAELNNVTFIDLYNDSFINEETVGKLLKDGVHPSFDGNVLISEAIALRLSDMKQ